MAYSPKIKYSKTRSETMVLKDLLQDPLQTKLKWDNGQNSIRRIIPAESLTKCKTRINTRMARP